MPNVVPIPLAMLTRPPTREADESAALRMITVLFAGTMMPRPRLVRASCGMTVNWVTGTMIDAPMTAQVSSARGQPEADRKSGQQQAGPRRVARPGEHRDQAEQVAQRHPLEGRDGGAELTLHGRKRDRDDAGVQLAHERAEADHAHREPWSPGVLLDDSGPRPLTQILL
jgi:hypothetical protein